MCLKGYFLKADGSCTGIRSQFELKSKKFFVSNSTIEVELTKEINTNELNETIVVYTYNRTSKNKVGIAIKSMDIKKKKIIIELEEESISKFKVLKNIYISLLHTTSLKALEEDSFFYDFPLKLEIYDQNSFALNGLMPVLIFVGALVFEFFVHCFESFRSLFLIQELELLSYLEIDYPPAIFEFFEFIQKINIFNRIKYITPNFFNIGSECSLPP